jgi:hypothetical protein
LSMTHYYFILWSSRLHLALFIQPEEVAIVGG